MKTETTILTFCCSSDDLHKDVIRLAKKYARNWYGKRKISVRPNEGGGNDVVVLPYSLDTKLEDVEEFHRTIQTVLEGYHDIDSIGDLILFNRQELLDLYRVGKGILSKVCDVLDKNGFALSEKNIPIEKPAKFKVGDIVYYLGRQEVKIEEVKYDYPIWSYFCRWPKSHERLPGHGDWERQSSIAKDKRVRDEY